MPYYWEERKIGLDLQSAESAFFYLDRGIVAKVEKTNERDQLKLKISVIAYCSLYCTYSLDGGVRMACHDSNALEKKDQTEEWAGVGVGRCQV